MSVEARIVDVLRAHAGTAELVKDQLFANVAPQDAEAPFLCYRRMAGRRLQTSAGPLPDELVVIQIDCVGPDYATSKAMADAVEDALDPQDGPRPEIDCALSNAADLVEERVEGSGEFDYIVRQNYSVWAE